jgi:hypothetical protein
MHDDRKGLSGLAVALFVVVIVVIAAVGTYVF